MGVLVLQRGRLVAALAHQKESSHELQPPMFDLHPMRALFLMSKSGYKPPTLKDKNKWSSDFHNFVKVALTKNPKKRPTGERMLYQPFILAGDLNVRLSLELLNKVRN